MSRIFFHVECREKYPDEYGSEVPDQIAARNAALEIVSHLVRDAADDLWRGGSLRVSAENERRARLFTVEVTLDREEAGAAQSRGAVHRFHSGGVPL